MFVFSLVICGGNLQKVYVESCFIVCGNLVCFSFRVCVYVHFPCEKREKENGVVE